MDQDDSSEKLPPLREAREIASRCLVLYAVCAAGHKQSRSLLREWLQRERLWTHASPEERALFEASELSDRDGIQATWRIEAVVPLLWALGHLRDLPRPTALCDVPAIQALLPTIGAATGGFVEAAQLRSEVEIWEGLEATYQAHWQVNDARYHGKQIPGGLNPGAIRERHLGLNWLTGNVEWDEVTTDT
ncbi:MAG: DUF4272 domain-containing protein [Bryobacteraceae bacterium]